MSRWYPVPTRSGPALVDDRGLPHRAADLRRTIAALEAQARQAPVGTLAAMVLQAQITRRYAALRALEESR